MDAHGDTGIAGPPHRPPEDIRAQTPYNELYPAVPPETVGMHQITDHGDPGGTELVYETPSSVHRLPPRLTVTLQACRPSGRCVRHPRSEPTAGQGPSTDMFQQPWSLPAHGAVVLPW